MCHQETATVMVDDGVYSGTLFWEQEEVYNLHSN